MFRFYCLIFLFSIAGGAVHSSPLSVSAAYSQIQFCNTGPSPSCLTSDSYSDFQFASGSDSSTRDVLIQTPLQYSAVVRAHALSNLSSGYIRLANFIGELPAQNGSDAALGFAFTRATFGDTVSMRTANSQTEGAQFLIELLPSIVVSEDVWRSDSVISAGLQFSLYDKGYFLAAENGEYGEGYLLDTFFLSVDFSSSLPYYLSVPFPPRSDFEWQLDAYVETRVRGSVGSDGLSIASLVRANYITSDGKFDFATGSGSYGYGVRPVSEPGIIALLVMGLLVIVSRSRFSSSRSGRGFSC